MLVCATFYNFAHETSGAARIRHSLRPLFFRGREIPANLGRDAPRECEAVSGWVVVIARSTCDEAIHSYFAARWIASRSLSSGAHSRDPAARNDVEGVCMTAERPSRRQIPPHRRQEEDRDVDRKPYAPQD